MPEPEIEKATLANPTMSTETLIPKVLSAIDGSEIERQLVDLASINGRPVDPTDEQPERYATNRVALSKEDKQARDEFIRPRMEATGMKVYEHPLGLIGVIEGKDQSEPPVAIMSHADTVPDGDMYDGVLGVLAGIESIKAMNQQGISTDSDKIIICLTGEESTGFNFPMFGSRAFFMGLTEQELDSRRDSYSPSIRELLTPDQIDIVKNPIFGDGRRFKKPKALIELHVEQDKKLEVENIDLGVVETIAAAKRFRGTIGRTAAEGSDDFFPYNNFYNLVVHGKADHSGATPMDKDRRADGLVATAQFLLPLLRNFFDYEGCEINIASIDIEKQSVNKIPGVVTTALEIGGLSSSELRDFMDHVRGEISDWNQIIVNEKPHFDREPIRLHKIERPSYRQFFERDTIVKRHIGGLMLAELVEKVAVGASELGVVGTATRYNTTDKGLVEVDLDIRGIEKTSREKAIEVILDSATRVSLFDSIDFSKPFSGSGDPVVMDPRIVSVITDIIAKYEIGSSMVMSSAAGHDAQNAARAGIPTAMIFVPSLNGGVAHNPDAYTSPESLEQGTKALAAALAELSRK